MSTLEEPAVLTVAAELLPYPNPFESSTTIPFRVDNEHARVLVAIYDLIGREIDVLTMGDFEKGVHEASWNGSDRQGKRVNPGVYVYSVRSDSGVVIGRISVQ